MKRCDFALKILHEIYRFVGHAIAVDMLDDLSYSCKQPTLMFTQQNSAWTGKQVKRFVRMK